MRYLAMADADKVQEYVFSPSKLRYVRGASQLQTQAIQQIERHGGNQMLYANGGVALAEFACLKEAESFCAFATGAFRDTTGSATVTTGIAEYEESVDGGFKQGWNSVRDAVERGKRQRNGIYPVRSHWLWAVCERCGVDSAQTLVDEPDALRVAVCGTCRRKWQCQEPDLVPGFERVGDFEKLAELSRPSNYLALIYLDLDRLGKYFDLNVHDRDDCKRISRIIDQAVQTSVSEAGMRASSLPGPHQPAIGKRAKQPFIELMAGGDDAIVMVAAHLAIPFLRFFREAFERSERWQRFPIPLFSVGLVFAHCHLPIWEFINTAKDLYRDAKQRKNAHSVAFRLVMSSMADEHENVKRLRKPTRNPYILDDLLLLAETVRSLKRLDTPRSKIHALYDLAWKDHLQGQFEYLNMLLRLPGQSRTELLRLIGQTLWSKDHNGSEVTLAADLAELWEFCR